MITASLVSKNTRSCGCLQRDVVRARHETQNGLRWFRILMSRTSLTEVRKIHANLSDRCDQ